MNLRNDKELQLKAKILTLLRESGEISARSVLTSEFSLDRSSVRADLAVLDTEFLGIEVKSEADSLRRLPKQLEAYAAYFDRTILVIAHRHAHALSKIDLRGAEVWILTPSGNLDLAYHRSLSSEIQRQPLTSLMTKRERERLLRSHDENEVSLGEAREAFSRAFRFRFSSTSEHFWKKVGRGEIRAIDLSSLSRFRERRALEAAALQERSLKWQQWSNAESVQA